MARPLTGGLVGLVGLLAATPAAAFHAIGGDYFGDLAVPGPGEGGASEAADAPWLGGTLHGVVFGGGSTQEAARGAVAAIAEAEAEGVRAIATGAGVGFVSVSRGPDAKSAAERALTSLADALRGVAAAGEGLLKQWEALETSNGKLFADGVNHDERVADLVGGTVRGAVTWTSESKPAAEGKDPEVTVTVVSTPATQGAVRRGPNGLVAAKRVEDGIAWVRHEARMRTTGRTGSRVIVGEGGEVAWVGYAVITVKQHQNQSVQDRNRQRASQQAREQARTSLSALLEGESPSGEYVTDSGPGAAALFARLAEAASESAEAMRETKPQTSTHRAYDGRAMVALQVVRLRNAEANHQIRRQLKGASPLGDGARRGGEGLTIDADGLASR